MGGSLSAQRRFAGALAAEGRLYAALSPGRGGMCVGMKKRGFTLIELLVVIAIIAILAAILFPIFVRVQQTARLSKCMNNAKQIGTACTLYEVDTNGSLLPGFVDDMWGGSMWYKLINPYLKQVRSIDQTTGSYDLAGVFICPCMPASRAKTTADTPNIGDPLPSNLQRCYGYNYCYLGGFPKTGGGYETHQSGEVVKSTRTIRLLETWNFQAYTNWTFGRGTAYCYAPKRAPGTGANRLSQPSYCWPPGWHNGRSTIVWVDNHVTNVRIAPPAPPGTSATADAYTGIMQEYFQNDNNDAHWDPYFRLADPKP